MLKTIIAAAALAATIPAAASAESRMVRHDDLNLSTPAGMAVLDRRIDAAARNVCGVTNGRVSVAEMVRGRSCMAQAKANAAEQVAVIARETARGG